MNSKLLFKVIAFTAALTILSSQLAFAMTTEVSEPVTAEDAGITLISIMSKGQITLSWDVAKPENLVSGFKIAYGTEEIEPTYPSDLSDYVYLSDNEVRSYALAGLKLDSTYYFRVCQYNGAGECLYYSNAISLQTPEKVVTTEKKETTKSETLQMEDFYFEDTIGHWSKDYAKNLKYKCEIEGYKDANGNLLSEFRPDSPITRAELAKMLVQCAAEEMTGDNPFNDVESDTWYTGAVITAKQKGWVDGYPDGTFKPNNNINRAEALKMIVLIKYTDITGDTMEFSDVDPGAWYYDYVVFAVKKGIVSGYNDGSFKPAEDITRGEAAKIISKVMGY